ncbi:MAG: DUF4124 domain-containing protein [Rudaea sp.]
MNTSHGIPGYRTLRLHEWLAVLALLFVCAGVRAESVYKCTSADGSIAYQASPCADTQRSHVVDIAPSPAFAPSPHYAINTLKPTRMALNKREPHAERSHADMAYECRGSGGEVFYRLGHCPHSVADESDKQHGKSGASTKSVSVSGHPVSRSLACSEMRRAGSIGRKGHAFDEAISSYDRNVGNDPCK